MSDPAHADSTIPNIQCVFEQLRAGKPVIVTDSSERENEGDFIVAAEAITPEIVQFLLRYGSGELCVSLPEEVADRLQLNPIVGPEENTAPNQTQFLIPIDHKDSGSGVSAECRAITIRALSDEHAQAKDFVRPGHIHPLLAKQGGILRRAGHTEATGDLLQMAGLKPVGVLIEILSQKGFGMADAQELREISEQFDIPIISTAEVIRHRYISEKLVHREVEVPINTKNYGTVQVIGYSVEHENQQPVALVWGDLHSVEAPWYACIHPALQVICWILCVVIVATSCIWPCLPSIRQVQEPSFICLRKVAGSVSFPNSKLMFCRTRDMIR